MGHSGVLIAMNRNRYKLFYRDFSFADTLFMMNCVDFANPYFSFNTIDAFYSMACSLMIIYYLLFCCASLLS